MGLIRGDEFRFFRCIELLLESGGAIGKQTRWLDLGCHQGQFLRILISRFGLRPHGSDDWDPSLKCAADSDWEYSQVDLEKCLPLGEPMDVISALEVLEHMRTPTASSRQSANRLVPGGWMLISTPNISSMRNRITVPWGPTRRDWNFGTSFTTCASITPPCGNSTFPSSASAISASEAYRSFRCHRGSEQDE